MDETTTVISLDTDGSPLALLRDEFRAAKRAHAAAAAHRPLVLSNLRVWDAAQRAFGPPGAAVVIHGAEILAVTPDGAAAAAAAAANGDPVIDCGG